MALDVADVGSFYIGGKTIELKGLPKRELVLVPGSPPVMVDPNGEFYAGQMYVQYVRLAGPKARYPLLMWHGGGLTGVTFETKPDGKPGWQSYFLKQGHDTYVSDAVERGRSGWSRYPEIYKSEPFFRTKREAWDLFRIGPADGYASSAEGRKAFANQKFPVAAFDAFAMQFVPRWAGNEPLIQAAYDELVKRTCPCVLLAHSQSAGFAFGVALKYPELIKGLVLIEPGGAPDPDKVDLSNLKDVPTLMVWGDHLDAVPFWAKVVPAVDKARSAIAAAGGKVEWIDLPKRNIVGNSHMIMMDANSDEVAGLVQDWFQRNGLMR
jgi:pimeloyl-ACP methyl ester carboxylesterase